MLNQNQDVSDQYCCDQHQTLSPDRLNDQFVTRPISIGGHPIKLSIGQE